MRSLLVEFIGTFFLMLTICFPVLGGQADSAPFIFGTTLIAMIYAGRHISGAHYNPAVTIALNVRGLVRGEVILGYVATQVAAAIFASLVSAFVVGVNHQIVEFSTLKILLVEFLGTFALMYVILLVATEEALHDNQYYG
ncbi:MAG: aquaporin, partial [Bdellovibrionales bacterium]|nr:aquaporin [Bdellovibrionales bacterium]